MRGARRVLWGGRENLLRSLEDSVTLTTALMPWTVSAVFMASTLGVPTIAYAPWAVFCCAGPAVSLLIAALYRRTGFGIRRLDGGRRDTPGEHLMSERASVAAPERVRGAAVPRASTRRTSSG
ncbi:hypothetical protein BH23ACI1_BH23ACI1_30390 [soil metagenome]